MNISKKLNALTAQLLEITPGVVEPDQLLDFIDRNLSEVEKKQDDRNSRLSRAARLLKAQTNIRMPATSHQGELFDLPFAFAAKGGAVKTKNASGELCEAHIENVTINRDRVIAAAERELKTFSRLIDDMREQGATTVGDILTFGEDSADETETA